MGELLSDPVEKVRKKCTLWETETEKERGTKSTKSEIK